MTFEQFSLDRRIMAGIQSVGYTTPTPIQEQAIRLVLQGRDVLGTAQTGTGKTAAFVLPILQRLMRGAKHHVRALVIAPTRELAEQIHQASVDLGRHTKVRSTTVYGGVSKKRQIGALRRGAEIVVACPGRLLDIMGEMNKEENITFIFSTHDARVVNKARRVVTIEDGKVISDEKR